MTPILVNGVTGFVSEPDLVAAEFALMANMKLIESVAQTYPDSRKFLELAAMARANYAFGFIHDELEAVRLTYPDSSTRAEALLGRTIDNFRLGEAHAKAALLMNEDFAEAIGGGDDLEAVAPETFISALGLLEEDDAPSLFWLAFNWGGRLQAKLDVAEATQLPKVEAMTKRMLELDEDFFYGMGPHLLAGTFYGFRSPALGGSPKRALEHFQRAKALSGGVLLPDVMIAQYVYAQTERQEEYEAILEAVIAAAPSRDKTLLDMLAKRKACRLLANRDQFFLDDPRGVPEACARVPAKVPLRPAD